MIERRCSFLVVSSGKPSARSKRIWCAEHAERADAGAVVRSAPVVEDAVHQIEILPHRGLTSASEGDRQASVMERVRLGFALGGRSGWLTMNSPTHHAPPDDVRALFAPFADSPREIAAFAYLDPEWRLLGVRHSRPARPTRSTCRCATSRATRSYSARRSGDGAQPSLGDPTPSRADIAATRRIARALDALGVSLAEHLILAKRGCTSLRGRGLL